MGRYIVLCESCEEGAEIWTKAESETDWGDMSQTNHHGTTVNLAIN